MWKAEKLEERHPTVRHSSSSDGGSSSERLVRHNLGDGGRMAEREIHCAFCKGMAGSAIALKPVAYPLALTQIRFASILPRSQHAPFWLCQNGGEGGIDSHSTQGDAPKPSALSLSPLASATHLPLASPAAMCLRHMAEREGFEPPLPLRVNRISSAARSTTLPPLRVRS